MATERSEILEPKPGKPVDSGRETSGRAEIDTSAPFESVKEAANRFGGMGFWKPISHKPTGSAAQHDKEMVDIVMVEEQAAQLERDLITKQKETLAVLKELETAKNMVEELRLKLQKEESETSASFKANSHNNDMKFGPRVTEEGNHEGNMTVHHNEIGSLVLCPSEAPGGILLELKQAKLNLTRTTSDIADIRVTIGSYNTKIDDQRMSLEKTRQRFSSNSSKISCLEEDINQTRQNLELVKDTEVQGSSHDLFSITRELQKLSSEKEQFKKVEKAARSEVLKAMSEIERTKTRIWTAEIRLIAGKRMKQAARASEALALAEIKALSNSGNTSAAAQEKPEEVTLSFEEYWSLISKAREAEEACKNRVVDAMLQVDEANVLQVEILKKVEEATEEVKISKKVLEEALSRVETAYRGKLAVEEALRMWRSEHGQSQRLIYNSTKFRNSHPSLHQKECGPNLVNDESEPVLKPTLSIGQILSRKLLLSEEYENKVQTEKSMGKRRVSRSLSNPYADPYSAKKYGKEYNELPSKRKLFGFARISLPMTNQSKKKNKQTATSMSKLKLSCNVN